MTGYATARAIFEFSEKFNDGILQVEQSRGTITTLVNGLDESNREDIKLALMMVEDALVTARRQMRDLQNGASEDCQRLSEGRVGHAD